MTLRAVTWSKESATRRVIMSLLKISCRRRSFSRATSCLRVTITAAIGTAMMAMMVAMRMATLSQSLNCMHQKPLGQFVMAGLKLLEACVHLPERRLKCDDTAVCKIRRQVQPHWHFRRRRRTCAGNERRAGSDDVLEGALQGAVRVDGIGPVVPHGAYIDTGDNAAADVDEGHGLAGRARQV